MTCRSRAARSQADCLGRPGQTAHHGKRRTLVFGPQSQALLETFMRGRDPEACLFSPREAEESRIASLTASRRTPLDRGNCVGTNRNPESPRVLGDRYTSASYRRAITRACEKAFPPPAAVVAEGKAAVRAWRKAHAWHPHQLRHTAGTRIRREFGLEAAAATLGHSSATRIMAHRRGLRPTRHATRGGGDEEDGMRAGRRRGHDALTRCKARSSEAQEEEERKK